MESKQQKIRITYEELCRIRKMGREQLERYLTEVMQMGYRQGYTDSEAETDAEFRLAEKDKAEAVSQALEENNRRWDQRIRNAVDTAGGIRRKQKELLLEHLKTKQERDGICRK